MKTKQSKRITTTIENREELEQVMGEYARYQTELLALEAEMNTRIHEIKAEYEDRVAKLSEAADGLVDDMSSWACLNAAEFGNKKSLELLHGVIGFRTGTPRVNVRRGLDEEQLVKQLQATGNGELLRTKIELDKQAVLAAVSHPETGADAAKRLAGLGIKVSQTERFFAEAKIEEVAK